MSRSWTPTSFAAKRIFGGQVLGQALNAAVRTVEPERRPHSLHGYFLRPGDLSRPIVYEVDPIRNGRSFSTRRVVGKQRGKAIFNASISFQIVEDGLSHQFDFPENVQHYSELSNDLEHSDKVGAMMGLSGEAFRSFYLIFGTDVLETRTPGLETTILLMSTALRPHLVNFQTHKIIGASLDHAMWFHEEIRVDQWIYYHLDSPRSARSRGFNRGSFYTEDGRLICSTAQEGLIRVIGERDT